jgi:hypothetical protein
MRLLSIPALVLILTLRSSIVFAGPNSCIENGGTPEELKSKVVDLLNGQRIAFSVKADGKFQILPQKSGGQLNQFSEEVRSKYGAQVLVSPSDLICGANAETDPSDVCHLAINLGYQALSAGKFSTAPIHEAKHLEQAAPQTNSGFDSLFFGRISNLDGTDHSFYPSFALDEIPAYAAEMESLLTGRKNFPPDTFMHTFGSAEEQLRQLVQKSSVVIERYMKFLDTLDQSKGYSAIKSDQGGIAIANLSKPGDTAIILDRIDWRNSGKVNTIVLIDGHNQLTIPLFGSKLDISKTINVLGKGAKWPIAPLAAELKSVKARLQAMQTLLNNVKTGLDDITNHYGIFKAVHTGERIKDLGLTKLDCQKGNRTNDLAAPGTVTK